MRLFQRFGERKDFDFAIDQILDAVDTNRFENAMTARFLQVSKGNSYLVRFHRFEEMKDLLLNHISKQLLRNHSTAYTDPVSSTS